MSVRSPRAGGERAEVIGSLDDDGATASYVIADITADGAWVSAPADDAASLRNWR